MMFGDQIDTVRRRIQAEARMPNTTLNLLLHCAANMDRQTNTVLLDRTQLAAGVGTAETTVSTALSFLTRINVLKRRRVAGKMQWTMNHNVASHLTDKRRRDAQAEDGPIAPPPEGAARRPADDGGHRAAA